ncbi:MAG: DUF1080 domain-containing protein [Verrucomicrobia bacterium]|nr:DUF1080 domain-containing protein [Verrucomicrobiota bacterium]
MMRIPYVTAWVCCLFALWPPFLRAASEFSDNFEAGLSEQWNGINRETMQVTKEMDDSILKVGKNKEGELPGFTFLDAPGEWQDFVFECEVKKLTESGSAGLRFRGKYEVHFVDNGALVLREAWGVKVHQYGKPLFPPKIYYQVKVVCTGGHIRVYVDGKLEAELQNEPVLKGKNGLLFNKTEACFNNVKLTESIPPEDALLLRPVHPSGALLFEPGKQFEVNIGILNETTNRWPAEVRGVILRSDRDAGEHPALMGLHYDPRLATIARTGGEPVFQVGGETLLRISKVGYARIPQENIWGNFYLRCDLKKMKGATAGVYFHNSTQGVYETYLANDGRLVLRKISPKWETTVLGATTKLFPDGSFYRLEIFRQAEDIAVFLDGELMLRAKDGSSLSGENGLFVNQAYVLYKNMKITNFFPPRPELSFPPVNPGREQVWEPDLARLAGKMGGEQGLAETVRKIAINPSETVVGLNFPKMSEGYYFVRVAMAVDQRTARAGEFPICIWNLPPASPGSNEGFFPIVVYGKFDFPGDPVSSNTYLHALCRAMKRYGINGIIHPFQSRDQLDILQRYGIRAALREQMLDRADHPSTYCMLVGDEPTTENIRSYKQRYDEIGAIRPDLRLITCMVGETTGSDGPADPLKTWALLKPSIRFVRLYPIRKATCGLLEARPGSRSVVEIFRMIQQNSSAPWWYVVQTFGANPTFLRPDPYWRNPTPEEVKGMMYLSLAYGAKGLFFYTLQSENAQSENALALVEPRGLAPCDGKIHALEAVSKDIGKMKDVLLRMEPGDLKIAAEPKEIVALPHRIGSTNYIFVVNLDAAQDHNALVSVPDVRFSKAADTVGNREHKVSRKDGNTQINLRLERGEGRLLCIQ